MIRTKIRMNISYLKEVFPLEALYASLDQPGEHITRDHNEHATVLALDAYPEHTDELIREYNAHATVAVDYSAEAMHRIVLPTKSAHYGVVVYLRRDRKPLLLQHFDALQSWVKCEVVAAATNGILGLDATQRHLSACLTKPLFRRFWNGYANANNLRGVPCPLDM